MVGLNRQTKHEPPTVADVVCPECFRLLTAPHMHTDSLFAGSPVTRRGYNGWCCHCDKAYAVIQYQTGNHWVIEKFARLKTLYVFDGGWISLNTPGEPPLVMTGTGGEYNKPISGQEANEAIRQAKEVMIKGFDIFREIKEILNKLKIEN